MNGPFSDLAALEAHFRARGFVDQNGLADADTADFYRRVLVPGDDRPYMLNVHIMSGETVGHLEVGLTAYFDPPARERVNADLAALAATLAPTGGEADETSRFLSAALAAGEEDERDVEGVRLLVVFPDREPDQTFEVVHVEAARPLEPGEWTAPSTSTDETEEIAVDVCRGLLRALGHPLADSPLTLALSNAFGEARIDVLRTDGGASLWLTTRPGTEPKLAIIHADGAREDF